MTLYLMQFFGGKRRQSQTNNGWCLLTDPMAAVNIHSPNAFLQPLSSVHSKYIDQADGWSFPRLLLLFFLLIEAPFFCKVHSRLLPTHRCFHSHSCLEEGPECATGWACLVPIEMNSNSPPVYIYQWTTVAMLILLGVGNIYSPWFIINEKGCR